MSAAKKISITVVVNGQPTVVDVLQAAPLGTIIPDALRQTEKLGPATRELGTARRRWNASRLRETDRRLRLFGKDSPISESQGRGWG